MFYDLVLIFYTEVKYSSFTLRKVLKRGFDREQRRQPCSAASAGKNENPTMPLFT